jgi:hypothetical protein
LLLPFLLWPLYTEKVALNALCGLGILAILALPFTNHLQAFLDPSEAANSIKLNKLEDYFRMFEDPVTLLFGRGLGVYDTWTEGGHPYYVTELTYLEMVRNFGLIAALVMLALLLVPIAHAFFADTHRRERGLAVAYFLYLMMCATNPNLFSSMGMLILATLLANIFRMRPREPSAVKRALP